MRAMRINRKKKECVNAPVGPFTMFSHRECDYNIRNELVCSRRDEKGAKVLEYQYQYDDIGSFLNGRLIRGLGMILLMKTSMLHHQCGGNRSLALVFLGFIKDINVVNI
jgi:hypothetical protein